MAEALLNKLGEGKFEAFSAGLEKGKLNPFAVEALKEEGIDITGKETRVVDEYITERTHFDYVITVCDETSGERCPLFPGGAKRLHWNFEDPSSFKGSDEEKLAFTVKVKNEIKDKIAGWVKGF
jgi:arsenate reductase